MLLFLIATFVCNTLLWAALVQPQRPPDEFSHFDYVAYLLTTGKLPVYGETAYLANPRLLNAHASIPPLYYALGAVFLGPARDQSLQTQYLATRMLSIVLGALTVALAYRLARLLAPGRPALALATAALVGFNPMFTYMSGAINSDNLITLLYAALLLLIAQAVLAEGAPSRRWLLAFGAVVGAGLITKPTIMPGVVVGGLAICWLAWRERSWRSFWRFSGWALGAALLISGWSFVRNWRLYGDPTGVLLIGSRPDVYPAIGYRERYPSLWGMIFDTEGRYVDFLPSLTRSFWGIFDGFSLFMPAKAYAAVLGASALGLAALIIGLPWRLRGAADPEGRRRLAFGALATLTAALTVAMVVSSSFNIDYQPQGRYLFPAIIPISLGIALGWEQLAGIIGLERIAGPLLGAGIAAINLLALFTTIGPGQHANYYQGRLKLRAPQEQIVASPRGGGFTFTAAAAAIDEIRIPVQSRPLSASLRLELADAHGPLLRVPVAPPKGPAIYALKTAGYEFEPGAAYTVTLTAQRADATRPLTLPFAFRPADTTEDLLNPEIVYAPALSRAGLSTIGRQLRSAASNSGRALLQRLLYPIVFALMCGMIVALLRLAWSWPAAAGAGLALALAVGLGLRGDSVNGLRVPEHPIRPIPPIERAEERGVVADLIWLEQSGRASTPYVADSDARDELIHPATLTISQRELPALAMHPTSALMYDLEPLPAGAAFHAEVGLDPASWAPDRGDGVEFQVRLETADGASTVLWQRYIDPKHEPADQRWHPVDIDLAPFHGQRVRLILATGPGPANDTRYDWAVWGRPLIVRTP